MAEKDIEVDAPFPEKLGFLFEPARYKVAYGGRGSGKSWGMARALIIEAAQRPLRILCARETQKSIRGSVHKLISDQIQALGLGARFQILEAMIRGTNGSEFTFAGLAQHTVDSIKSYEGVDRVWVEEAQTVSKKSWDILVPTIRKPGSEIWVSFNPDLDTDETYQRFVINTPPDTKLAKINFNDNEWFSDVLEQERQHCERTAPDDYPNIWLGYCRKAAKGAIYSAEVEKAYENGQVRNVPYDPALPVHTVWDLGWNDSMSIILVQKSASELRVIDYIEDSHRTLAWYVAELGKLGYVYGDDWLPHDGNQKDYRTGKSAHEILRALGRRTKHIPLHKVNDGIRMARMAFPRVYFDKDRASKLIESLKRYRRQINPATGEPGEPVHDEYSHGADAFRYLCVLAERMRNEHTGRGGEQAAYRPPPPPPDWRAI